MGRKEDDWVTTSGDRIIATRGADAEDIEQAKPTAVRGRPLRYDWDRIVVEICWHLATNSESAQLTQPEFVEKLREWCRREPGVILIRAEGKSPVPPSAKEIEARIQKARIRFPR